MSKSYVYVLRDDKQNDVRYVGRTNDPIERIKSHVLTASSEGSEKERWIIDTYNNGGSIGMEVIEECDEDSVLDREQFWINHYLERGDLLVNAVLKVVPSARYECRDDIRLSFRLDGSDKDDWKSLREEFPGTSDKYILRHLMGEYQQGKSIAAIKQQVGGATTEELKSLLLRTLEILESSHVLRS